MCTLVVCCMLFVLQSIVSGLLRLLLLRQLYCSLSLFIGIPFCTVFLRNVHVSLESLGSGWQGKRG